MKKPTMQTKEGMTPIEDFHKSLCSKLERVASSKIIPRVERLDSAVSREEDKSSDDDESDLEEEKLMVPEARKQPRFTLNINKDQNQKQLLSNLSRLQHSATIRQVDKLERGPRYSII